MQRRHISVAVAALVSLVLFSYLTSSADRSLLLVLIDSLGFGCATVLAGQVGFYIVFHESFSYRHIPTAKALFITGLALHLGMEFFPAANMNSMYCNRRGFEAPAASVTLTEGSVHRFNTVTGDPRGFMDNPFKQLKMDPNTIRVRDLHYGEIKPGSARGAHYHEAKTEILMAFGGEGLIRVAKTPFKPDEYEDYILSKDEGIIIVAPPGVAHYLQCSPTSPTALQIVAITDAVFNVDNPMTVYNLWPDLGDPRKAPHASN